MDALAETNLVLARANEALVARLDEHDSLKASCESLRVENATLVKDLQQVRADKTALEQEMHLGAIQRSTRRVKLYVSILPFTLGITLFFVCMILMLASMATLVDVSVFVWFWGANAAALPMFLVIKPTDDALIRFFTGFGTAGGPPFVLLLGLIAVVCLPPLGICPVPRSNSTVDIVGGDHLCWNTSICAFSFALLFGTATVCMLPTLRRHGELAKAEPAWRSVWAYCTDWSKRHSCVTSLFAFTLGSAFGTAFIGMWAVREHQRGHMTMPVRLALSRVWMAVRLGATVATTVGIVCCGTLLLVDANTSSTSDASDASARELLYFAMGSYGAVLLIYSVQTPAVRAFIHGWINRCALAGEAGRAAGVAAMVGKLDAHAVLNLSRRHFRGLAFSSLRRAHLDPSSDAAELRRLAKRTPLGSCDAFISHSWHDDPDDKWAALTAWAASFVPAHGREPVMWFDRACIDQQKIEEQLACLPVWLSGCRTLLVLAGSTYTQRLWCVLECFTVSP